MITVKNLQLNNEVVTILTNLMNYDIKASSAFKLMRIIKELSAIIDDKLKTEKIILNKWALKDDNGEFVPVRGDDGGIIPGTITITNFSKFEEEMSDLLSVENTIPYDKINFEVLGLEDNLKIKDLLKIEFIFE
jgi:hypothetical protein